MASNVESSHFISSVTMRVTQMTREGLHVTHMGVSVEQQMSTDRKIENLITEGFAWLAIEQMQTALQAFSEASKLRTSNVYLMATIENNIGVALAKLGKVQEAEEHYLRAEKLKFESNNLKARILNNKALLLLARNEIEQAQCFLLEASSLFPSDKALLAKIQNNLGISYKRKNNLPVAMSWFLDSLSSIRESDDLRTAIRVLNNLGALYLETGTYGEAKKCLDEANHLLATIGERFPDLSEMIARNRQLLQ